MANGIDSLKTKTTLLVNDQKYSYYSLPMAEKAGLANLHKLPFALKELKDSRGRGLGVFRGVSLKLEEGQSFHHVLQFIWIGNGLSEDYLSERIAELNRLEPFYKRQGRDRVRVEKFSEGLAVAFPPYYSLEALVHFKVTLDIHLGRK